MKRVKIRTVTTGVVLSRGAPRPEWRTVLERAAEFNKAAVGAYEAAGFVVQTSRIATNPFEEYVDASDRVAALDAFSFIDAVLLEVCGEHAMFNAGPARSDAGVALVADLVTLPGGRICASAELQQNAAPRALDIAHVIKRVSAETKGGEGNFNFCCSCNMPSGVPFFPAAYHDGAAPTTFAVGCEMVDAVAAALAAGDGRAHAGGGVVPLSLPAAGAALKAELEAQLRPVQAVATQLATAHSLRYGGIDASIAPNTQAASVAHAFEQLEVGGPGWRFGECGTLSVCAMVTAVLKALDVKLVGYSGLMLPPAEDLGLAERANQGTYGIRDLLQYSAVCGLGLDTVPVAGDVPPQRLAALLLDIAALAYRLNKPLSARLFPVPGKAAGEMTAFENQYLCNCNIFAIGGES